MAFRARYVDLAHTVNPIEISVRIGNESGRAAAALSGRLALCGVGYELVFLVAPLMWLFERRGRGRA